MREKELKQLRALKYEIDQDRRRLEELEALATATTGIPSYIPAHNKADKVSRYAIEIAMLREKIEKNIAVRMRMCNRLYSFIEEVDDSLVRQAIKLRYVDCKSWSNVAKEMGGGNTADSVRKLVFRSLRE